MSQERPYGYFIGRVVTNWLGDGRRMQLMEEFAYVDPHGTQFVVPTGFVVDGSSIPGLLWGSRYGSPLTGRHRKASVPHDFFCVERRYTWEATHKMFHLACLAAGVEKQIAWEMYQAVMTFGPKWDADGKDLEPEYEDEWMLA